MLNIIDQKSNWVDYPLNLQSFYKALVKHIAIEGLIHHQSMELQLLLIDFSIFKKIIKKM
jgi:hypothetical protein